MKVHLEPSIPPVPSLETAGAQKASAPAPASAPEPGIPASPRPRTVGERFLQGLTQWAVALPVLLISTALLGWSLCVRLPEGDRVLTVNARALPSVEPAAKPMSADELGALRQRVENASTGLMQKREEMAALLSHLEEQARKFGWRVEIVPKPAVRQPGGLEELSLQSVVVQLEDEGEQPAPAYNRLLAWLREVSSSEKRVEVVSLQLRSVGAGLGKVVAELRLFSPNLHEEPAAK